MKFGKVFEDENVLVVNKPSGLVVNRSETTREETLQDQLSDYFQLSKGDLGIGDRVGIVHRLDRETSGLLVVAKKQKVFDFLQKQFKARNVKKEYIALVHGEVKNDTGSITAQIGRIGKFGKFGIVHKSNLRGSRINNLVGLESGGRDSVTRYEVIKEHKFDDKKFENILHEKNFTKSRINYLNNHGREYALLKIMPLTGRTHQIRVHLKSIGHPVVSDRIYSPTKLLKFDLSWCPRLFLHASFLGFKISKTKSPLSFRLDLPKELKSAILNLS
ncbi:MAG: pseudouridine synthase [Candidatus Curtissbacteria bacterium GW2011_GWA1_41_11]|uniref:Pseudouridine synthase n=1 Tax=Candidatus Curtissbacteria bacterium GW2011_GWA1_41_11 TaxID=1618409 RepID=A0A0G0UHL1_9BACT|nr:MAG: pseudouridine synthase [Candidatus Curtissbacteria bacterium GW2011_GWA1_41_11]